MIAIPSLAVEVLFVGGGSAPESGADEVVMSYLQNFFGTGNVDYMSGSAVSKRSEAAYDLLVISSTLGSGTVRNKFEDSTIGIVNWEEALMDDSSEGDFFLSNTIVKQNVVSPWSVTLTGAGHPIQGRLPNGNIVYVKGGGNILFSNAGDGLGVESIGHDSDNTSRKFIQYAEVGAALLGIGTEGRPAVASGRRVSFSLTDSNFDDLTPEGLTLFGNACHWAAGAMEVVVPSVITLPVIVNHPAKNRVSHGADIGMEVKDDGGEPPMVTVYYGGHDGGTTTTDWEFGVAIGAHTGVYEDALSGLTQNTTYYYRAHAVNSAGEAWAPSTESFTTLPVFSPMVELSAAESVSSVSVSLGGTVTSTGGEAPAIRVYYGLSDGSRDPAAWDNAVDLGPKASAFSSLITGLDPETRYFFTVAASNAAAEVWADSTFQFTTLLNAPIRISEFMASNNRTPVPGAVSGTTDDWIEIHNSGGTAVNLAGWHLTDRAGTLNKWTFPSVVVPANGYLVVFASGNNRLDANGNLHTGFKLSANGEYLALVDPNLRVTSEFGPSGTVYPRQDPDISYGLARADLGLVYFDLPTPGRPNGSGFRSVADTKFSVDRGVYDAPFEVVISTKTPGATIRYTVDGSEPRQTGNGMTYVRPIVISRTTILRAVAFKIGFKATGIDTQTYLLMDADVADPKGVNHVLRQTRPAGYGNLSSGGYDMDPKVSKSVRYEARLLEGLRKLPAVSIAMDKDDWAGSQNGIYIHSTSRGLAWERACSAEFIFPDGKDVQVNCGIRVQGGASRNVNKSPKHSLSLRFREVYGPTKFRYPLFGDSKVSTFNTLSFRAGYNNSWIHSNSNQRKVGSMIRDQWVRDSLLDMGNESAGEGYLIHLYINGLYWGVYNLTERHDHSHYAQYHGGDDEEIDARNGSQYINGNSSHFKNVFQSTVNRGNWAAIERALDVDGYIDYQLINRFGANHDLKTGGNWRAAGGGVGNRPWQIYAWDSERVLESPSATNVPLDPFNIRDTLERHEEYRIRLADRIQKHFFAGGALTPSACVDRWMKRADELDLAIIAESARWGDHRRATPYTRDEEWIAEQNRLILSYFPVRTGNVLSRLRQAGLFPSVDAPQFQVAGIEQLGGEIPEGASLTFARNTTTVYYTLDGSDPRLEGGDISPSAVLYTGGPISLPRSGIVRVRGRFNSNQWTALNQAEFYLEPFVLPADLKITEINYHPVGSSLFEGNFSADEFEFIELQNVSGHAVNLKGVRFEDGIEFTFGNFLIESGERVVVVENLDAFRSRFGSQGIKVGGQWQDSLENDGEHLLLLTGENSIIHEFSYNDSGKWPGRADGKGSTLEVIDPEGDYSNARNWRSSSEYNGTPGKPGQGPDRRVVVNEVVTHTDFPLVDTIELYNTTEEMLDISGWYLSDRSANYRKFRIPTGTEAIPPGGYVTFSEADFKSGEIKPIELYSGTPAAVPVIVTSPDHGLSQGDVVTVSGYAGLGHYNETFEITVLDADRFLLPVVFLEDHPTRGTWVEGKWFSLSGSHGDELWLSEADADGKLVRFVDHVSFGASANSQSLGRWPNGTGTFFPQTFNTPDASNSGPDIGSIIISEIMYNPSQDEDAGFEFVELLNTESVNRNLANYTLRGEVDFDFSVAHDLGPSGLMVVVGFDPVTDVTAVNAFRMAYGIDETVLLVGPWRGGRLDNAGARLRFQRPDEPTAEDPGFFPQLMNDEVRYDDEAPWPISADGGGDSLNRIDSSLFGNYSTAWEAVAPSPGFRRALYDHWRNNWFGGLRPSNIGPFEDFDADGFINLVEYLFDMDPTLADAGNAHAIEYGLEGEGEGLLFTMIYRKNPLKSDAIFKVQSSRNLDNWIDVESRVIGIEGVFEIRKASVPAVDLPQMFLRLRVGLTP